MESSQWENLNSLFCRKDSFLTGTNCHFRSVGQAMVYSFFMALQKNTLIADTATMIKYDNIWKTKTVCIIIDRSIDA